MTHPKSFYAVIGRMCGDDEDTCLNFAAGSKEEAIARFREDGKVVWGVTEDELRRHERNGEGFFIYNVLVSSAPIHEV